ncbi:cell division protein FtsQ/DivIB [Kocuria sp. TGY1127_2]|uniref:cell division protein FtsQ/DivIB n=1 Tax=Kocuria sp. TGY1127_2 TaxID=2711328 RepID=UPI0015BF1869|nr:cell division protein FtsQ/DivIB [Kocuria sp. TGY1127_2]
MSPAHRPRLPRRQEGKKTSKEQQSNGKSSGLPQGETDPRSKLAEATARGDAGPDAQRSEAIRSSAQGTQPRPAAVRVNDESKVQVLSDSDLEHNDADTRSADNGHRDGEAGTARGDQKPSPDGDEAADNIVAFPGRRPKGGDRGTTSRERRAPGEPRPTGGKPRASRRKKVVVGLGAVLIAAVLFFGIVFFSPLLATQSVTVQGAHLTDKTSLQKSLDSLKGKPLTRVTTQDVKDRIGDDVVIQDVSIEAHPPHELVVTVHERAPVAVVKSGDQYVMVDKNGVAIGAKKSVEEAGVPLLDGGPDAVKGDSFKSTVQALQTLPQSLLGQLNKVEASSSNNIRLDMKDGSQVVWGTGDQSEYKAEVLTSLVQGLKDSGGASVYDVSSPDHPVTK